MNGKTSFNPSRPVRQRSWSSLDLVMACLSSAPIKSDYELLSIGPLGTNISQSIPEIQTFLFMKMHLKMPSAKWRPFYLGLNVSKFHMADTWWPSWIWGSRLIIIILNNHFDDIYSNVCIWNLSLYCYRYNKKIQLLLGIWNGIEDKIYTLKKKDSISCRCWKRRFTWEPRVIQLLLIYYTVITIFVIYVYDYGTETSLVVYLIKNVKLSLARPPLNVYETWLNFLSKILHWRLAPLSG